MKKINMLSKADSVEGQGVGTAYLEQVNLVTEGLSDEFEVLINSHKKADIIHIHSINPTYYLRTFFKGKTQTVGYVHFLPVTLEKSLNLPWGIKHIFYWYVIAFYRRMDKIIVVNPIFIESLEGYKIDRNKITYIPNFVSEERFFPMKKAEIKKTKQEYEIEEKKFIVLSVGQLQLRKGVLDFIELAKSMPDVEFIWAGGFSFGKMTEGYEEIKKCLKSPPKNTKFLGIIDRDKMNALFNMADVMFQPSYDELFPMVILEAMSSETPLLLRDLEEYKPILPGYYLKGTTNKNFKNEIEKLRTDKSYHKKAIEMAKKGKERYSRNYVLEEWKKFYKGIVNQD